MTNKTAATERAMLERRAQQRGAAMLIVLLSMALLFSLGVPFLFTGKTRADASRESFDRARARIGTESAAEYSRWALSDTHPSFDSTPWWDDRSEWELTAIEPMPQALGGVWEQSNESWGMQNQSAQSLVSLATAPPLLLQNLLHPSFLTKDATFEDSSLTVTSTDGFPDSGFIMIGGAWLEYQKRTATTFDEITPALELPDDTESTRFREGEPLLDQRIVNLCLARMQFGEHRAPEFLDDVLSFNFGDPTTPLLPEADRRALESLCWLSTGAFGEGMELPSIWTNGEPPEEFPSYLPVADSRAFSAGTMVRINSDAMGLTLDSIVLRTNGRGIFLPQGLPTGLPRFNTTVTPMRRDPVDINSCEREILEALVLGLRFAGRPPVETTEPTSGLTRRHYVSRSRARDFADAVVNARPLQGPDDLWQRVLEPLLRRGSFSHADAWSIHLNGMDPNNGALASSTTGFAYRSGDRYLQRLHAAYRSRLGRTLARAASREDVQIAPAEPLIRAWQTQRDFEEAGRYARGLHQVFTVPNARGTLGGHLDGQSGQGMTQRVGSWGGTGLMLESDDPDISGVQPQPAIDHWQGLNGSVNHFEVEASPFGWDIAAKGPLPIVLEDSGLRVDEDGASSEGPVTVQAWFEMPSFGAQDGVLFDFAGDFVDRQRMTAAFEEGELVVRAFDNAGDDPGDEDGLEQALTIRIDPSEYPIEDRWFHVAALLRSVSFDGFQGLVDGINRGETEGRTHLVGALSAYVAGDADGSIQVESTEGFPSRGALKIGGEVLEYSSKTDTSFILDRAQGPEGYIGGRAAREPSDALINLLDTDHPEGAGVEVYGYSAILSADIPPGGSNLNGAVGPWSLSHVVEGEEDISIFIPQIMDSFSVGTGITGDYVGPINLAEAYAGDPYYAEAFQESGGYAVMLQRRFNAIDSDGHNIGGFEVVRYSSRQGTVLNITERNVVLNQNRAFPDPRQGAGFSYVTEWNEGIVDQNTLVPYFQDPTLRVFVLPISIGGQDVSDLRYTIPEIDFSEFVQITNPSDAGLTEWVRYDSIVEGYFVRDDMLAVYNAISGPLFNDNFEHEDDLEDSAPGNGGGPPGGGNAGGGTGAGGGGMLRLLQEPADGITFVRRIGEPVSDRPSEIEEISRRLQFRGVMGTYDHAHSGGEDLVPVLRTFRPTGVGPETGFVGRLDRVAVMDPTSDDPPFWFTVNWAMASPPATIADNRLRLAQTYVAFDESPNLPYARSEFDENGNGIDFDIRELLRLCKFPSGERPEGLRSLFVGSSSTGQGGVFGGVVDELVVGETQGMGGTGSLNRGSFLLEEDLAVGDESTIRLNPFVVLIDGQRYTAQSGGQWLSEIPSRGLLVLDGEYIAYTGVNTAAGEIEIAPGGRGMLGSEVRGHAAGARLWAADARPVAFLQNGLSASQAEIALSTTQGFGQHSLMLMDEELVHAPQIAGGNVMQMPRYRWDADNPDQLGEEGDGMLRARFGTQAANHSVDTLVYSFPNRWVDLYMERHNSGAGAWLQLGVNEPSAMWDSLAFEADLPDLSHHVRVLARSGAANWEDDPDTTPGLVLIDNGRLNNGPVPLNLNGDQLDLRVGFDWTAGAFDPVTFAATGWTSAPVLRNLQLFYLAQSRVQRSEEVQE